MGFSTGSRSLLEEHRHVEPKRSCYIGGVLLRRTIVPRVVITGLGLLTPLGNDVSTTWEALCQGKSGVGQITTYDSSLFGVHFAADITNFNASLYMDGKVMCSTVPYEQFVTATIIHALAQS